VPSEPIGEGLNSYVYYVVGYTYAADGVFGHYTYDKWTKLPAVRPEHIMVARQIKKLFSGELDAPVNSYPPFPGNEGEYLAAQIARISRGATLAVEGLYYEQTDEATEVVTVMKKTGAVGEEPFEVKPSGPDGLSGEETYKTMWVHHPLYPSILSKMGRCSWPVKPLAEGEEEPPEDEEKEEGEARFKSLEEEVPIGEVPGFSTRLATPILGNMSPAVISSNRWIGAYTIALESKCVSVYVGNGVKYTGTSAFQVAMPPALPAECSDFLPGEEGSEEPGPARPGMQEQTDEPMPDPFLVVDGTAEEGEGEEETG
jgi:radial spoke head protein 4A